jgi:membrane protein DedA with SNARE-associated domain
VDHFLTTTLTHWGYVALVVVTAVSAMGPPVGSEAVIAYSGALASGQLTDAHHHMSLAIVILLAVIGELVGSTVGYAIGRYGGRPLVDRAGRYILLTHRDLDRAEAWFGRRGEPFVFFGRLIPLLRSFVSIVAGLGEMALGKFWLFTVAGSAVFTAALSSLGYSLGGSWHRVLKDFNDAGYVAAALAIVLLAVAILHRLSVVRAERARHSAQGLRRRAEAARRVEDY